MKVDRQVIIDLLPVYLSGEASPATRSLVEECFREDPDLERAAKSANRAVEGARITAQPLDDEKEKTSLMRARDLLRYRNQMLGFSFAYSLVPIGLAIAGRFFDSGVAHKLTVLALWFAAYAAGCWIAFLALAYRARKVVF